MYSVLIADDEYIDRLALIKLIEANYSFQCDVREAKNGIDALDMCREAAPDVILLDIEMPGLTGMELLAKLSELRIKSRIIIISAYSVFEYAAESLKYGVCSYLLKPFSTQEVKDTLDSVFGNIDEERNARHIEMRRTVRLQSASEYAEGRFLNALVTRDSKITQEIVENGLMGFDRIDGVIIVAGFRDGGNTDMGGIDARLRDIMRRYFACCVGILEDKRVVIYLDMSDARTGPDNADAILAANIVDSEFGQCFHEGHTVYVSGRVRDISGLYRAADSIAAKSKAAGAWDSDSIVAEQRSGISYSAATRWQNTVVKFVKEDHGEKGGKSISGFFRQCPLPELNDDPISCTASLLILALGVFKRFFGPAAIKSIALAWLDKGRPLPRAPEQAVPYINSYLKKAMRVSQGETPDKRNEAGIDSVAEAKKFMREHFNKNISLSDIASWVGLSESYFSKSFKRETGKNYIEYLTELRISFAKEQLKNSDLPINVLAEMCGYNNVTYFCRVFKKATGETVAGYRQSVERKTAT